MSNGVGTSVIEAPSPAGRLGRFLIGGALALGIGYVAMHVTRDLADARLPNVMPFVLLGIALRRSPRC